MTSIASDAERMFNKSKMYVPIPIPERAEDEPFDSYRSKVIDLKAENARIEQRKNKYLNKAIELFDRLCLSAQVPPQEKLSAIETYFALIPQSADEISTRFRDMVPHLRASANYTPLVTLLSSMARSSKIPPFNRVSIAVTFYNNYMFTTCYELFTDIAFDDSIEYTWRVDSCRYLFASEEHVYVSTSQEVLITIIEDPSLPSPTRYSIIASFITKTGINTLTNALKIRVKYNEPFVAGLQTIFFYNLENGVRERILSGQHMLQMSDEVVGSDEKEKIVSSLLDIAKTESFDDNTRADAADVVLRLGSEEMKHAASAVIREMGASKVPSDMCNKGTIMDSASTIYSNSQNTHSFSEQTTSVMEDLVVNTILDRDYNEVYDELIVLIKKYVTRQDGTMDNSLKFRAMKALNRVNQDTATFTKYNISLSTLLVMVWCRIESYSSQTSSSSSSGGTSSSTSHSSAEEERTTQIKAELKKRVVEELIDMGETCSTGHADRFVNVLSGYEYTLKISWEDQIVSNVIGRINARIRDCEDPELKDILEVGKTDLATEEEKERCSAHISLLLEELKEELSVEFVDANHVTEDEFILYFERGASQVR